MEYQHRTGKFSSHDGLQLYYQMWSPPNARPERTLVIHHGLGEHSGRYQNVLEAFDGTGINIVTFDARGHGRSEGSRGDSPSFTDLLIDLEDFLILLRNRYQVQKPVLLGHSMGGLVVIGFCLRYSNQWSLKALVTSGAGLRPHLDLAQRVKKETGKILNKIKPDLILPSGLPPSGLSHDPEVARLYNADPLTHDKISVRMGLDLIAAGEEALKNAALLKIPTMITHGKADPITDSEASVEFFQGISSAEKEIHIYPELFHEIYNESASDRHQVLSDLRAYVLNHLPEDAAPSSPAETVIKDEPNLNSVISEN